MKDDNVIAVYRRGEFITVGKPITTPRHRNFLIICEYGDYSGFRTLDECFKQQLAHRPDHFYQIVERL